MPPGNSWLSLKVYEKVTFKEKVFRPGVFISVPKKAVALATRRNRLKRLVREAVRTDVFFKSASRAYHFRVNAWPGDVGLADVRERIRDLK